MDGVKANSGFSLDSQEMVNGQACYSNNTQKLPIRDAPKSRLRDVRDLENGNNGENVDVKDGVSEDRKYGIMGYEENCMDGIMGDEEYGEDGVLGVEEGSVDTTKSNDIVQQNECMDDEEDEEDSSGDSDDEEDNDEDDGQNGNGGITDDAERHIRKRKLKSLALSYEFAPRVPPPQAEVTPPLPVTRRSSGGRNSLNDWTERETFVLLEALGERFLQHGKRSLRADEWKEVSKRVSESETSRGNRVDSQCRNRLDTLKKKYKKEKSRLAEMGGSSKWVYFSKMDMLMSSSAAELTVLSGGLGSREDGFAKRRVYANGMDKKRDTPGNSQSSQKEEDSDGLLPKKRKSGRESSGNFRLLECSFKKFTKIYEKIENRRAQQMIGLEKMRNQFQKDLETERQQITKNAQAEIARIRLGDRHDETSVDN
ncbi:hypothetical protein MLD38_029641 [Melastoma candidum]|uniref:Uncharacterized protein n=1 Tax=Melastoma candidum TaxID=119954 RepID=A0ACB9N4B6_9MYRT|nr:hypothetical protein MLD38_029641 [Melastoma candidum]